MLVLLDAVQWSEALGQERLPVVERNVRCLVFVAYQLGQVHSCRGAVVCYLDDVLET